MTHRQPSDAAVRILALVAASENPDHLKGRRTRTTQETRTRRSRAWGSKRACAS